MVIFVSHTSRRVGKVFDDVPSPVFCHDGFEFLVAARRVLGVGIGAPTLPDTQVRACVLLAIARGRAHVELSRRGVGDAVDALHVVQRPVPVGAHASDDGLQCLVVDANVLIAGEGAHVAQAH